MRRLDVGGKLLTNALQEALSYRQFNLMEDTAVVGAVKEALCFVAQDFPLELALAQRLSAPGALSRAAAWAWARPKSCATCPASDSIAWCGSFCVGRALLK